MSDLRPTAQVVDTAISLDSLNDDVLLHICSMVQEVPEKVFDTYQRGLFSWETLGRSNPPKISALTSLSMVNRRLRNVATFILFRRLSIVADWEKAGKAFKLIDNCPAMLETARSFTFASGSDHGPAPSKALPSQAVRVLQQMPRLKVLKIAINEFHTQDFIEAFKEARLSIPGVKTVIVGSYCDFVVDHCPKVETVCSNGYIFLHSKVGRCPEDHADHATRLIKAAGRAPYLTSFEMDQWWRAEQVEQVYQHMPHIKRLAMPGGRYQSKPKEYLQTIGRFDELEELILAHAANLRIGFHPPHCGNAYKGPGGATVRERVAEQGRQARERIAREVFGASRSLKKLWVGESQCAEASRDENGRVTGIKWANKTRSSPSSWIA